MRLSGVLATIGSIALLLAMSVDVLAVAGRHLGVPLLGSIEIVQACVVLAASAAMLGATLSRTHASVHLLTERLRAGWRGGLARASAMLCALLFFAIAAGSIWVAAELWNGHEVSEILGLPIRALRVVWCIAALAIALAFFGQALRHAEPPRSR